MMMVEKEKEFLMDLDEETKEDSKFTVYNYEDFKIRVECSGCQRNLFLHQNRNIKVGASHVQLGLNFFLFNSAIIKEKSFNSK